MKKKKKKKNAVSYVEELDLVREEPHLHSTPPPPLPIPCYTLLSHPTSLLSWRMLPATWHVLSLWVDLDAAKYND